MSRTLKKTPAEIYHVGKNLKGAFNLGSEIAEYTFNNAVVTFGSALEAALDEVEAPSTLKDGKARQAYEKAMRLRVLKHWLPKVSDAEPETKPAHQFADPANRI
jgi:hypothetical protein